MNSLLVFIFITFCLFSCNESFLQRYPKDQVSEEQYWNTANDLESYVNSFYPNAFDDGGLWTLTYGRDGGTDNMVLSNFPSDLAGSRVIPSGGGWSYSMIRRVNYFLENYNKIEESGISFDTYKQFVGEAHFFRAFYYFSLVKDFGDIPYYTNVLTMDSDEELYASRTPRQVVVENIIEDLDKAIEYMSSGPNREGTRLNKEIAQLFKSRVCLYEGTWEKYHQGSVFGVPNSKEDVFFEMAANSALDIIESGKYSIYNPGNSEDSYFNLFNQLDYSSNPEVMLWEKYSEKYGNERIHNHQNPLLTGGSTGFTKSLIDSYLCKDGLPIASSSLYSGDQSLIEVSQNRDPRLSQTIWITGQPIRIGPNGDVTRVFERSILQGQNACTTGYQTKKGAQIQEKFLVGGEWISTIGTIYFRFAEVLLNYAEAKAELGVLTQNDVDVSINKLRDRVGMPHLILEDIPIDPNWSFPELTPVINEIRRERRIELVAEGFRKDDLFRWRAHQLFIGKRPKGALFDEIIHPEVKVGEELFLDNDGYIDPYQINLPQGYEFNPERDYLNPISIKQLTLNENLEQNPGW